MTMFRFLSRRAMQKPIRKSMVKQARLMLTLEELEARCLPSAGPLVFPMYQVIDPHLAIRPLGPSGPAGLDPAQVRHAYGIDAVSFPSGTTTIPGNGAGETIAIVDAYDDPSIASDLTTFDQQFGLPAPPSFTKVGIDANGNASTTSFPAPNSGWAGEIELDVEWSHAIAPAANILLVEANSASTLTDLTNAIDYAASYPGVVAVSMSWGGSEFTGEQNYDSSFTTPAGHPGVTFIASSGDGGAGVIWPSASSHVVAAGGTTLDTDSNGDYLGESAWSGSGGGISAVVAAPSYQANLQIYSGDPQANGMRAVPDVAYDADPNTGVAVYGAYGWNGWAQVGGTSASAPQWAAIMAIVDQGRGLVGESSMDGYTQTLPALYALPASAFNDITTGSNGYLAGPGFDLATGRGTPIASQLIPDLGAPTQPQVLTSVLVSPATSTVGDGGQEQFSATALDQFGRPMIQQPAFTWTRVSGAGTLSSGGLYSAPTSGTGSVVVEATAVGTSIDGTAAVNYLPGPAITSLAANPSPVTGTTTTLSATLSDPASGNLDYTWSVVAEPGSATTPTFSTASGTTAAGNISTLATFYEAGIYQFQLTVTDGANISASDTIGVTVAATPTSIFVSPPSTSLGNDIQQQFGGIAEDQFGNPLATQPSLTWSVVGAGTITSAGLYTSPSSGAGTDTVEAQASINGATIDGAATVAYAPGLTIVSVYSTPSPITGTTATLNALVSDPSATSLFYSWTVYSIPDGGPNPDLDPGDGYAPPGIVSTGVTFYSVGTFQFELDVTDNLGKSASQILTVTVTGQGGPTITSLGASPNPVTGATTTLSAMVADSNPGDFTYNWSVTSIPTPTTPYPVINPSSGQASPGSLSAIATFYAPGTYTFELDITDSWGETASDSVSVTVVGQGPWITSLTASPNPVANGSSTTLNAQVTDGNQGMLTYNWSVVSLPTPSTPYPVINPSSGQASPGSLSAGVTFYAPGNYTFQLNITDAWGLSATDTVSVTVAAQPPSITSLTANPNPVTGTTTTLSAQIADLNAGQFTYAWTVTNAPAGVTAPTINPASGSASPGSLSATATFYAAGAYQFQLAITDSAGLTATATVTVNVSATATSVVITPASATVGDGGHNQFTASVRDQFGNAWSPQPTISWAITNGAGTINAAGLYTAPASGSGSMSIQASATVSGHTLRGSATVTLLAAPTISAISASPSTVTGTTTTLNVTATDPGGTLSYAWSTISAPAGAPTPTFSTPTAHSTVATFYEAGVYKFQVQVTNQVGLSTTATVSVTVNQTLTTVVANPATVPHGTQQQLAAAAYDQFGLALSPAASFTWSLVSGPGSVTSAGLYKAPTTGTGRTVLKVTATRNGVTVSVDVDITIT